MKRRTLPNPLAKESDEVWAVLEPPADGSGAVIVNGERVAVEHPGAFRLVAHDASTTAELEFEVVGETIVHGISFAPGLAPEGAEASDPS